MGRDIPRDFETVEEYRARVARESVFEEPVTCETDLGKVLEPPAKPPLQIKPGSYYARLAYEAGDEDEYSNRMKARYGGEW